MQKIGNKYLNIIYKAVWKIDIKVVFIFTHWYATCRRLLKFDMERHLQIAATEETLILGTD